MSMFIRYGLSKVRGASEGFRDPEAFLVNFRYIVIFILLSSIILLMARHIRSSCLGYALGFFHPSICLRDACLRQGALEKSKRLQGNSVKFGAMLCWGGSIVRFLVVFWT